MFELLIVPFPRNPSEHLFPYWIISLFHVGVASLTYLVYFFILGLFVEDDNWQLGKELLAVAGLLLVIGVGEWGIRPIIYSYDGLELRHLVEEIWHAYLSGGLVYLLVLLVNVNFLTKKHQKESKGFRIPVVGSVSHEQEIITQNASDHFMLNPSDFICTKAEGNYLLVITKTGTGSRSDLKRLTLQSFCEQLQAFEWIFQTHRGFAVNTQYIKSMKGNAQGYQLQVEGLDFTVPVSRKYVESFKTLMNV